MEITDENEIRAVELLRDYRDNRELWNRGRALARIQELFLSFAKDTIIPEKKENQSRGH